MAKARQLLNWIARGRLAHKKLLKYCDTQRAIRCDAFLKCDLFHIYYYWNNLQNYFFSRKEIRVKFWIIFYIYKCKFLSIYYVAYCTSTAQWNQSNWKRICFQGKMFLLTEPYWQTSTANINLKISYVLTTYNFFHDTCWNKDLGH